MVHQPTRAASSPATRRDAAQPRRAQISAADGPVCSRRLERVDPDLCGAIGVPGVERKPVIIEIPRDHDPEESADGRHGKDAPHRPVDSASKSPQWLVLLRCPHGILLGPTGDPSCADLETLSVPIPAGRRQRRPSRALQARGAASRGRCRARAEAGPESSYARTQLALPPRRLDMYVLLGLWR
jgi:hypothetical protein